MFEFVKRLKNFYWQLMSKKLNIELAGGLGNQIFQYYAGKTIAEIKGYRTVLDLTGVARSHSERTIQSFEIDSEFRTQRLKRLFRSRINLLSKLDDWLRIRNERHLRDIDFKSNMQEITNREIDSISGYFQDFNYMIHHRNDPPRLRNTSEIYRQVENSLEGKIFAGIHIRRGDFVGQSSSHGCISSEWYIREINSILIKFPEIEKLVVFSDDIAWVVSEIIGHIQLRSAEVVLSTRDLVDPAESWSLLGKARYIICANSTFSLTAAFFSKAQVTVPWPLTRNSGFNGISQSLPAEWILSPTIWE